MHLNKKYVDNWVTACAATSVETRIACDHANVVAGGCAHACSCLSRWPRGMASGAGAGALRESPDASAKGRIEKDIASGKRGWRKGAWRMSTRTTDVSEEGMMQDGAMKVDRR